MMWTIPKVIVICATVILLLFSSLLGMLIAVMILLFMLSGIKVRKAIDGAFYFSLMMLVLLIAFTFIPGFSDNDTLGQSKPFTGLPNDDQLLWVISSDELKTLNENLAHTWAHSCDEYNTNVSNIRFTPFYSNYEGCAPYSHQLLTGSADCREYINVNGQNAVGEPIGDSYDSVAFGYRCTEEMIGSICDNEQFPSGFEINQGNSPSFLDTYTYRNFDSVEKISVNGQNALFMFRDDTPYDGKGCDETRNSYHLGLVMKMDDVFVSITIDDLVDPDLEVSFMKNKMIEIAETLTRN